ncbi:MAG: diacylglycerol/lipid kinase family protein [Gemmatimonadaceae bacterium]
MGPLAVESLAVVIGRALLIVNPASRRGARDRRRVEAALAACGVEADTRLTRAPGDAAAMTREMGAGFDAVFTLGGDGTIMEALGALAGSGTPLGALAAGTGNLLVRAMGIPLNPARAVAALCAGHVRAIDLAALGSGGHFAVAAGVGIDVAMLERTRPWLKRRLGVAAYVLAGAGAAIGAASHGRTFRVRITADGVDHDVQALSLLVANVGSVLSGWITLVPDGRPDDGMLDVVVYAPRNLPQALRVASRMLRGRFPDDGLIGFYRGRHIQVCPEVPRQAQADGELLLPGVLDATALLGAARLLVPGAE